MKVQFCGAARNVTGSSHLITLDNGYKILLDCGLFQGGKTAWESNNRWWFDPAEIDCLILSHAHIDHTGRVPQLVKDGFKGEIHCTHATRSLCAIMLLDSALIQERDVEWYNNKLRKKPRKKRKKKFRNPLYTSKHVQPTMDRFVSYGYDSWHYITPEVEVFFSDTGHILGSASITLRIKEEEKETIIGFTGDIGRPDRPILRDPAPMPEVDYLICESTYGNKDHEDKPKQAGKFLEIIKEACIDKRGKLIIPAFSVGRTQEIVYMMDRMETEGLLPHLPIYVDSPLAVNATVVFGSHPECYDDDLNKYLLIDNNPFGFSNLKYIRQVNESKALNDSKEPCVIISSSGMMNAGRVKHHLANNIENENNTFLIVGYCSPETPGGMLRNGVEVIKLFGEWKQVNAKIEVMESFSAHGDRNEIHHFIENQKNKVKKIFLVHGEYEVQKDFKNFLHNKGFNDVTVPAEGTVHELT